MSREVYACVDIGDHHVGYAVVGIGEGTELVVWGIGETETDARADAQEYLDKYTQHEGKPRLLADATEFCVKPISARERDRIQRGDVQWPPAGRP